MLLSMDKLSTLEMRWDMFLSCCRLCLSCCCFCFERWRSPCTHILCCFLERKKALLNRNMFYILTCFNLSVFSLLLECVDLLFEKMLLWSNNRAWPADSCPRNGLRCCEAIMLHQVAAYQSACPAKASCAETMGKWFCMENEIFEKRWELSMKD